MRERLLKNDQKTLAHLTLWMMGVVFLSFVVWLWLELARYVLTDRAYERLVECDCKSRDQVDRLLASFRQAEMIEVGKETAPLARHMTQDRQYIRFTILGARRGIDVVFDHEGNVIAVWPDYE
jgi:hypothetical protein